jgi:prolipoprotein diacylglyceryltransferase
MVIAIALGCAFIRIGNFFNSEIIGKPTESNYGIVFTQPIANKIKSQLPFVKNVKFNNTDKYYKPGLPILQTSIEFENSLYMEERIRNSVEKRLEYILPSKISTYTNVINPYQSSLHYSFHRNNDQFELRFKSVGVNRHPAQLYEAINYFILGVLLFLIWNKHRSRLRPGSLLGLFFLIAFSSRFLIEGFKENQVSFESSLYLNMGQLLSVPMFLLGFYFFCSRKKLGAAFRLYN